jgi:hypothetical protein
MIKIDILHGECTAVSNYKNYYCDLRLRLKGWKLFNFLKIKYCPRDGEKLKFKIV